MKHLQKLLTVLLVVCMVLSLAACAQPAQSPAPAAEPAAPAETTEAPAEPEEAPAEPEAPAEGGLVPMADAGDPISFDFFIRDPKMAPASSNPVLNKITELTGVTINYEFLVGDLDQKMGVMIAGEDYPDAIFAESQKFIDAGAFIPLDDLIPQYENLNYHYSPYFGKMTNNDGHMYILELYGVRHYAAPIFQNTGSGFYIQKAVLEDAGYPIPRTLDEYFTLIENYKAKYPEIDGVKTIGFEILCDGWRDFCLRNPAQHLMGTGNEGDVYVDLTTYKSSLYQITDTAKAYYKKLNEEFHKGVIEAETLTQNYDQYLARLSSGAVLGMFDQQWNFGSAENVLKTDGKDNRTYVSVPITNPGVPDGYIDKTALTITGNNGLGITKNCKNPERLLAFCDWLLQREVQDYLQWGEEGVDYIQLEDGGKVLTETRRATNKDETLKRDTTGDVLWQYTPKHQGLYEDGEPCGPGDSDDEFKAALTEYDQKFLTAYGFNYFAELLSEPIVRPAYYPVWSMNLEDGSAAAVAHTKVEDICRKYYPRLVICEDAEYDGLWNEFLAEMDAANLTPYTDEVDRMIADLMAKAG